MATLGEQMTLKSANCEKSTCASKDFYNWLCLNREVIVQKWVSNLSSLSASYKKRPKDELTYTVNRAFEANLCVIGERDYKLIDQFIDYITQKRLKTGFPLSDVQKAFELFRFIVVKRLSQKGPQYLAANCNESLNACLSYTIHRFSDHFQSMHEKAITEHALDLEQKIKQRTRELAASQRHYKTLVEEINDGYFVIEKGRILFANQAFCRMHNKTLEQIAGKPFISFVAKESKAKVMASYAKALTNTDIVGQLEYQRSGVKPEKSHTEIRSRMVDLGRGMVIIGICRDISKRVAMEKKVRENERMAYVGHLTASLSHEIRNPLSAIKMNLQLLERKLDLEGFDLRRLQISVHEVSRLEQILRQLLDYTKPLALNPAPMALSELVKACLDLLEPKISEKSLKVSQKHSQRLPLANLDPGKIEQAFINLSLNAIEALPFGGSFFVWTKAYGKKPFLGVELGIKDNGPGLSLTEKKKVFTPFYTSKNQGTGLGLSNVKRIVKAHKGEVLLKSRKNHGASFIMRLPCRF